MDSQMTPVGMKKQIGNAEILPKASETGRINLWNKER